jgi:5-methylcytosine-specific restriction enzyme A
MILNECSLSENSHKSTKQGSFTLVNANTVKLCMKKSIFVHNGTSIPVNMRGFFNVDKLPLGEHLNVTIIHNNIIHNAYIAWEFQRGSPKTRLFWRKDLREVIQTEFPDHYNHYWANSQSPISEINMTFTKSCKSNEYVITF